MLLPCPSRSLHAVKEFYEIPESGRKICIQLLGDAALKLREIIE
jgi:hypothetical protein